MHQITIHDVRRAAETPPSAHDRTRQHIETLARRLYILAWVIEGVAVALGLGMALVLQGESTIAEFLLGGGGFVMVACAELSKIPLATFFVECTSRRSKLVTLAFLLLMSFITFATIFFSLERGFNGRMHSVSTQAEEIARLRADHTALGSFAENPSAKFTATRRAIEMQLSEIEASIKIETGAIGERREILRKEQRASDLPKEIDAEVQRHEARRRSLLDERDRKMATIDERARQDSRSLNNQLEAARKAADAERYVDIKGKIIAASARADRERVRAEKDYRGQLSELETAIKQLTAERVDGVRRGEAGIKPHLEELTRQEERIYSDHVARRDASRKQLADLHTSEAAALEEAARARRRGEELASQIGEKEAKHRRAAAESQLHRIASWLAGWWTSNEYEPHTVPDTYVRRVAAVWFGSMAALGALGGAVVAMISQLLMRRAAAVGSPDTPPAPQRSIRAIDRLLLTLRLVRRLRPTRVKTVEIVKTRRHVVAVPVPVTGASLEKLQAEFKALSAPLSEQSEPDQKG